MSKSSLVQGKRIQTPGDIYNQSRKLKKANQTKSDLRTFEQRDKDEQRNYFKTKEDVVAEIPCYAFEEEDLTPRRTQSLEEMYGKIIENSYIDQEDQLSEYEPPTLSVSGVNRDKSGKKNFFSNPFLEKGVLALSEKVGSWKYKFTHKHAQGQNFVAKGTIAPKNLRAKPKGKMRKAEWRKLADKNKVMSSLQIDQTLNSANNSQEVLIKFSA